MDEDEIVNKFAPQIKSGELQLDTLSKDELIKLMIKEPILIKRPLLIIGEEKVCRFDINKINRLLSKSICEGVSISTCQSEIPCEYNK